MITNNYALGFGGIAERKAIRMDAKIERMQAKIKRKEELKARKTVAKLLNKEKRNKDKLLDYFDIPHTEELVRPYEFSVNNSTSNDISAHIFNFD